MAHGTSSRVPTIEEVVSRFEQWRQTRQGVIFLTSCGRPPLRLHAATASTGRQPHCTWMAKTEAAGSGYRQCFALASVPMCRCLANNSNHAESRDGDMPADGAGR